MCLWTSDRVSPEVTTPYGGSSCSAASTRSSPLSLAASRRNGVTLSRRTLGRAGRGVLRAVRGPVLLDSEVPDQSGDGAELEPGSLCRPVRPVPDDSDGRLQRQDADHFDPERWVRAVAPVDGRALADYRHGCLRKRGR